MSLILLNSSIVLVAQKKDQVSPLDHSFLVHQKVIPNDFVLKKNHSFTTPIISQLHYENGFSLITESELKRVIFQIANLTINDDCLKKLNVLKDTALKYLQLLGHKYQNIGINFDIIADDLDYNVVAHKIVQQDVSQLHLNNNKGQVNGIDLSYNMEGKKVNISIKSVNENNKKICVPFFAVNIHYPGDYSENQATFIAEIEGHYKKLKNFTERFYDSNSRAV